MFEELIMVVELDNPQTAAPHKPQMVPVEEVKPSAEKLAWLKAKEEFMASYSLTDETITPDMKEIMLATIGQEPA